jgi:hypothetical protein
MRFAHEEVPRVIGGVTARCGGALAYKPDVKYPRESPALATTAALWAGHLAVHAKHSDVDHSWVNHSWVRDVL